MEVVDDERFYDRFDWDVAEGGFAPLKSKYAITTDTDVAEGKTYYTKSDSTYTVVAKPTKTNIGTYYEKTYYLYAPRSVHGFGCGSHSAGRPGGGGST